MFIQYQDHLPTIPLNLLPDTNDIINYKTMGILERDFYSLRMIDNDLKEWLKINVIPYTELSDDENLRIFYQVMSNGKNKFPMHKDKNRVLAYNYILETGGNDVRTNIYDDNKNLLESKCLPAHRWHSIQVNRYHDLTNLPKESRRVAVTMHSYIQ